MKYLKVLQKNLYLNMEVICHKEILVMNYSRDIINYYNNNKLQFLKDHQKFK